MAKEEIEVEEIAVCSDCPFCEFVVSNDERCEKTGILLPLAYHRIEKSCPLPKLENLVVEGIIYVQSKKKTNKEEPDETKN